MIEGEVVGWHCRLIGREFEQTPGDGEGQGSLAGCSLWVAESWTRLTDRRPPPISHLLFHFCFVPCISCHLRGLILCPSVCVLSRVGLFVTLWTVARQALTIGVVCCALLQGIFPTQG